MKIEAVDAFYLRMPDVKCIGDGSQDALLIRVSAGGFTGWGECEASPLPTIAALIAPISHSACQPVLNSVLGATIDGPASIRAVHRAVHTNCFDLLQADHALSGIDIALWDLLGKVEGAPVWSFFSSVNMPKTAYASQLFGATPEDTFAAAKEVAKLGYLAAKFGWGPIGTGSVEDDRHQVAAAREGLGLDRTLLVDTGCIFDHDLEMAAQRIGILEEFQVGWWEEPFATGALAEYSTLSERTPVSLAAGEGAHNADQAKHLIDYGGVTTIQIDTGRVGGITAARQVAEYARSKNVHYVNHTFTSNLALSASLQPYPEQIGLAEVPTQTSELARAIGGDTWSIDAEGAIAAPAEPGLGIIPSLEALQSYRQAIEIRWNGKPIWTS